MSTLVIFTSTMAFKSIQMTFSLQPLPMVLKVHVYDDEAAGLWNDEIQPGPESKMAAVAKK